MTPMSPSAGLNPHSGPICFTPLKLLNELAWQNLLWVLPNTKYFHFVLESDFKGSNLRSHEAVGSESSWAALILNLLRETGAEAGLRVEGGEVGLHREGSL